MPDTPDDSWDVNPEVSLLNAEKKNTLENSISKLPEPYKSVLILKEYDDLTYAEIASIIGVSIDNVKVLLFRGRQKLKNLYRRDYYNEV